ncbi:adenylate/guanylate cyclase domain-containing protein [Ensifer sp. MJa1]|uniref:adenylate/guanylate cyclase domain-containing protein n=1 Tax=Ensifer sp. MJa1 TaxID=2919888 RepID=UPI00300B042C
MERRLAAVLIADVVGYGQRSQLDEEGTRALFQTDMTQLFEPRVKAHRGRLIKTMGDGVLVEFPSVVEALQCAIEIQDDKASSNAGGTETTGKPPLQFRIGVNVGDVIVEGDDIHGDGVNIADRVQGLALPGGIALSGAAYDQVKGKLPVNFVSLGEQRVKSLSEPVRVYRVSAGTPASGKAGASIGKRLGWRIPAIVAAVLLLLSALVLSVFWQPLATIETASLKAKPADDLRPSLVVLPFDNLSADKDQEYVANGLTEDLTTALARVPGLFVISRNTAFAYKGKSATPAEITTELGVRYLLEGSIRRVGGDMRINAQLIDGATSGHVWAERFDGRWEDVFALQDKVVGSIAGALQLRLVADIVPRAGGTSNPAAYDAYLKAMDIYSRENTPEEFAEAVKLLQQAVALDPNFGAARAQLAWAYWDADTTRAVFMGLSIDEAYAKVGETLAIAARNPSSAYYQLVAELKVREHASDEAVNVLLKAVALDPSDSWNQLSLAHALNFNGKPQEALGYLDAAARVDPNSWVDFRRYQAALAQFTQGNFEAAIDLIEKMNFNSPDPWAKFYALQVLVSAYAHLGRTEGVASALARLRKALADRYMGEQPNQLITQDYMVFKNAEDIERLLAGLSKAGVPELPALGSGGLVARDRLTGNDMKRLLFGSRIRGRTALPKILPIEQAITANGELTETVDTQTRKGTAWVQGNFLCKAFPGELSSCGAIYRNAFRTPGREDEYRAVHRWQQYEFSVVK